MVARRCFGFTLVELLVVLVIIGMLLALLLSALNTGGREPGRRAQCLNNQRQIGLAMQNYEAAHGHFPGYVNRIGDDPVKERLTVSWVVPLLAYLERRDLSRLWHEGNPTVVEMDLLICPSDPPEQSEATFSYVVNCGLPGDSDMLADGVFFNHDVDGEPMLNSLAHISEWDGVQNTLLLSENIQAGLWSDTTEADLGMVWRKSPGPCSPINECTDVGDRPQDLKYARPSSRHGDGVVVIFCDGHGRFLSEDIDYRVYQHLMTPDSRAAGVPGVLAEYDF